MDSDADARSTGSMHVDTDDGDYSDTCDYDEYNEEELYGMDEKTKGPPECSHISNDPESINYECLSVSDVETMVNNWVATVTELFTIPPSQAKLLLQLNNWDLELIKKAAGEDQNEFLTKNGLRNKEKLPPPKTERRLGMELRSKIAKKDSKKQESRCGVCWEDDVELVSLDCGHTFCTECWPNYIKSRVEENQPRIMCMEEKCKLHCQEDFVRKILAPMPEVCVKYEQALYREMISTNPMLSFCSGPDCQTVIYSSTKKAHKVVCKSCNTTFCFQCGQNYHAPATSKQPITSVPTPKTVQNVTRRIEKNGGCNHMHCTKCGEHFCWVCCQDWKSHGSAYYNCSRYNETSDNNKADARKALERYLHYFTRYENHQKSLRLEHDLLERIKERIDDKVKNHEGTWIDWQYLYDAASLLTRCRYTLQYTYPFAFYMADEKEMSRKELFEYQQALLEKEVEELSWKVERAESTDRGDLETQMHIAEQKRRILLKDFF
ncbi:RBR-type E3 ubiquitin transferase [Aphelenchoides bicaudatus]|nr:RBR-type E3 ubiquitin transferase [Aphelenchoides bicaudatus]